jgi:hypothetical protein
VSKEGSSVLGVSQTRSDHNNQLKESGEVQLDEGFRDGSESQKIMIGDFSI